MDPLSPVEARFKGSSGLGLVIGGALESPIVSAWPIDRLHLRVEVRRGVDVCMGIVCLARDTKVDRM